MRKLSMLLVLGLAALVLAGCQEAHAGPYNYDPTPVVSWHLPMADGGGSHAEGVIAFGTQSDGGSALCLPVATWVTSAFLTNRGPAELDCGGDVTVSAATATLIIPAQVGGIPSTASVDLVAGQQLCCVTSALQVTPNDTRYRER